MDIRFVAKAKAFSHEATASNQLVSVDQDGVIRVWDHTAGAYTLWHVISDRAAARIRKVAIHVARERARLDAERKARGNV